MKVQFRAKIRNWVKIYRSKRRLHRMTKWHVRSSFRSCTIRVNVYVLPRALFWEIVTNLIGGPLPDSDWSWLKASLPSSVGGLSIRQASLNSPAAYISSYPMQISHVQYTGACWSATSTSSCGHYIRGCSCILAGLGIHQQYWYSSHSTHPFLKNLWGLLMSCWPSAPNIQSKVLALSSAIQHASDYNSILSSLSPFTGPRILFQPYVLVGASDVPRKVSVSCCLYSWGWPFKWDVEGIATEIHFRMQFSLQLRQLP